MKLYYIPLWHSAHIDYEISVLEWYFHVENVIYC